MAADKELSPTIFCISKKRTIKNGFLYYKDITRGFIGWRHFSWQLDGQNNGTLFWGNASRHEALSSINIFQVSGPWNQTTATFYLDNVRLLAQNPADLNSDDLINQSDLKIFVTL